MTNMSEIVLRVEASDFLTDDIVKGIRAVVQDELRNQRYMIDSGGVMPEGEE